jgi:pimeloyl-ACP methyl ester carboxylesterase
MAQALPTPRQTIGLQAQAIAAHDTHARLPQLSTPTLVVHGTADRVIGYPNGPLVTSLIPGARLETLEDVGHLFWWEQPERSAELVREHALAAAAPG